MSSRTIISILAFLIVSTGIMLVNVLLSAAAPPIAAASTPNQDRYAAFSAVVARHQAMSDRVTEISRRLRVANAPLCEVTQLDAGLITHELTDYPEPLRPLALHFMDLGEEGRFIRSIVPGSPADRTEMKVGDQIVSGWPISAQSDLVTTRGAYPVEAEEACVAPTFVVDSTLPNASTDGREIILTTAVVEQVADDTSLAFIIAHEMGHILRAHSVDGPRWTAELEADTDALTLMRNADYDINRAVSDWEASVEAHRMSQSMSATHPPISIRLRFLQAALDRLEAQPEGFLLLEE
ncbi:MAG: M48 family metalloprotease [Pseudomonadota bacterium]